MSKKQYDSVFNTRGKLLRLLDKKDDKIQELEKKLGEFYNKFEEMELKNQVIERALKIASNRASRWYPCYYSFDEYIELAEKEI